MADNGKGKEDIILEIKNLRTYFFTDEGIIKAVDGVDLELRQGETLSIVGESGSGKSVTSLSIMRLIDPPGRIVDGEIWFGGQTFWRYLRARWSTSGATASR